MIEERRKKKERIDQAQTRNQTSKAIKEYSEANKSVKKACKKDKREWIEDIAAEAEEAANKQNMKELYNLTRTLSGKGLQQSKPARNKDGEKLSKTEDQLKRWKEHFEELFNRPALENPPELRPAEE